jgi:hypothetical protein
MNHNIKTKWVAALRSGDYKQTKGALRRPPGADYPEGYCCLGVLCEVVKPNAPWLKDGDRYTLLGAAGVAPQSIVQQLGLTFDDQGAYNLLPHMNDGGRTFEEIADFIEERL